MNPKTVDNAAVLAAVNAIHLHLPRDLDVGVMACINILVALCCEYEAQAPGWGRQMLDFCQNVLDDVDADFEACAARHEFNQSGAEWQ